MDIPSTCFEVEVVLFLLAFAILFKPLIANLHLLFFFILLALDIYFQNFIKDKPRKFAEITNAVNSTGNYMNNVKNNKHCFHSFLCFLSVVKPMFIT